MTLAKFYEASQFLRYLGRRGYGGKNYPLALGAWDHWKAGTRPVMRARVYWR